MNLGCGEILRACKHSEADGTYTVCLADALQQFGFNVSFHSELDSAPTDVELDSYKRIQVMRPKPLSHLIRASKSGASVIVSYAARGGEGHFSPLAGVRGRSILLAYTLEREMLISDFEKRWRSPGVLRQAISATPNSVASITQ